MYAKGRDRLDDSKNEGPAVVILLDLYQEKKSIDEMMPGEKRSRYSVKINHDVIELEKAVFSVDIEEDFTLVVAGLLSEGKELMKMATSETVKELIHQVYMLCKNEVGKQWMPDRFKKGHDEMKKMHDDGNLEALRKDNEDEGWHFKDWAVFVDKLKKQSVARGNFAIALEKDIRSYFIETTENYLYDKSLNEYLRTLHTKPFTSPVTRLFSRVHFAKRDDSEAQNFGPFLHTHAFAHCVYADVEKKLLDIKISEDVSLQIRKKCVALMVKGEEKSSCDVGDEIEFIKDVKFLETDTTRTRLDEVYVQIQTDDGRVLPVLVQRVLKKMIPPSKFKKNGEFPIACTAVPEWNMAALYRDGSLVRYEINQSNAQVTAKNTVKTGLLGEITSFQHHGRNKFFIREGKEEFELTVLDNGSFSVKTLGTGLNALKKYQQSLDNEFLLSSSIEIDDESGTHFTDNRGQKYETGLSYAFLGERSVLTRFIREESNECVAMTSDSGNHIYVWSKDKSARKTALSVFVTPLPIVSIFACNRGRNLIAISSKPGVYYVFSNRVKSENVLQGITTKALYNFDVGKYERISETNDHKERVVEEEEQEREKVQKTGAFYGADELSVLSKNNEQKHEMLFW